MQPEIKQCSPKQYSPKQLCSGVIYQVYLRSFFDTNDDGIGDLPGLIAKLPDIAALGCDAIWINPCYPSPQYDHGYDVADYRDINPEYGTLADFRELVESAHALDMRVLMDIVPNHCSTKHVWFQQALQSPPGSPERNYFIFRPGKGVNGELPPNNWQSVFGGSAWTQIKEPAGVPGEWYLHLFDSTQPDFNWRNPVVAAEFLAILDFWYSLGVDGFRIDVAHGTYKDINLPDDTSPDFPFSYNSYMWNQPEVHELYRSWRQLCEEAGGKYLVGEVWLPEGVSKASYVRPDELHQAFAFDLLVQPWDAEKIRAAIEFAFADCAGGEYPAWALANHDVHRAVTRYGQERQPGTPSTEAMIAAGRNFAPTDIELGKLRALAMIALVFALPGATYIYQGEELGLPEYLDMPDSARQDPIWKRNRGIDKGRDGCRIPLPWESESANFGFSNAPTSCLWLPQPQWFAHYARDIQEDDADSFLSKYKKLIHLRRQLFLPSPETGFVAASEEEKEFCWLSSAQDPEILAFRSRGGICVMNLGENVFSVPNSWCRGELLFNTVLHSSSATIPPNSTSWYKVH